MPALAALITTVGRAALTANAFAPVAIHVGSGTTVPTNATTALATPEAIIAATVQAQQVGDDVRLHVVALDSTTDAYDVREWALVDAGGDFLVVYGSATLVAAKAAGSHLHLALDVARGGRRREHHHRVDRLPEPGGQRDRARPRGARHLG